MADEFNALIQNGTWSLVPPNPQSASSCTLLASLTFRRLRGFFGIFGARLLMGFISVSLLTFRSQLTLMLIRLAVQIPGDQQLVMLCLSN
ncbi:hypothetical protein CRG98_020021 [Punica granatum]|uniref:Uncharacterized protein n=1 Tax=Punica granatum TaxID=22663 RepID=A0A2I0JTM4_PUNGR|nr:hypothetical protein CRG98_020021 [Punica granatum]